MALQKREYKDGETPITAENLNAIQDEIIRHGNDKNNPHGVTREQIGAAPALDWSHIKWYVIGDSLTDRNASHTEKYYYDFVQEKTGIQIIVDGIGGTGYGAGASNSESYYDRVQNIPDDVDIVTIFGSGNDIRFAESANMEIYNTLSWLALNKPGLRVIVVPPAPWLGYNKREDPWKAYCDRLQACASVCNFRYVSDMYDCPPFNPNFTGHMESFFTTDPEGIHPDENGHKALAPYFYNALLEELALDSDVETPGGGSGQNVTLTTAQINALDGMFKVCAFIKDDVSAEYNAFKTAFGISDSSDDSGNDDSGEVIDKTLLYNWDFTNSLVDTVRGVNAILAGSAKQDTNGISFISETDEVSFSENLYAVDRTYEFDVESMNITNSNHGRFFMVSDDSGFIYRSANPRYWTWYCGTGWDSANDNSIAGASLFNGKTVKVYIDGNGYQTLYVDGVEIVKSSKIVAPAGGIESAVIQFGSSAGNSAKDVTISGFRVYKGVK